MFSGGLLRLLETASSGFFLFKWSWLGNWLKTLPTWIWQDGWVRFLELQSERSRLRSTIFRAWKCHFQRPFKMKTPVFLLIRYHDTIPAIHFQRTPRPQLINSTGPAKSYNKNPRLLRSARRCARERWILAGSCSPRGLARQVGAQVGNWGKPRKTPADRDDNENHKPEME